MVDPELGQAVEERDEGSDIRLLDANAIPVRMLAGRAGGCVRSCLAKQRNV